jgi:RNA ligase (TIGR02306 family)
MAFFGVTLETLSRVEPHPNADRLDLARVVGLEFQFVVGRGRHVPGERVVYFPVDAVLAPWVLERLGLVGRLAGSAKNRVKTVTLRGEISQGLVGDPATLLGEGWQGRAWPPDELTAHLGVTKYEAPVTFSTAGVLHPLPDGVGVYDIDGADRFPAAAEALMDQPVQVTEKLEGTNFAAVREPGGAVVFCQRENAIEELPGKENLYCETARRQGVPARLDGLAPCFPGLRLVLRGELIGPKVQGNPYGLSHPEIRFFDLKVGDRYLPPSDFVALLPPEQRVPLLCPGDRTLRAWLAGRTLQAASDGPSALKPAAPREGVVVKPLTEQWCEALRGRLVLKQRSPAYLAGSEL